MSDLSMIKYFDKYLICLSIRGFVLSIQVGVRKTQSQMDGRTDRKTYKKADGGTNRQTERQVDRQTDKQAKRQTDRQTEIKNRGSKADRQTHSHTNK
jgi:hypothetical protein